MFNLLPENLKNEIRSEYGFRRLVLIMSFVLLIEVSSIIFISPSWFSSYYNEKDAMISDDSQKSELDKKVASTTELVKTLNKKISILKDNESYHKPIKYLDSIIENKSSSIKINQFSYSLSSITTASILIEGLSSDRESLISFVDSLKQTGLFKTVDSPVSNLAKDKNIRFSINLTISS